MNIEEWHADIEINEMIVKDFLQEKFPSLGEIKNIQFIGEGWDNKIYLVNQMIFRFPRRKAAIKLMERESFLLNHLPKFTDIKTPYIKYIGKATSNHPYPCQGYEMIKGRSGYQANLSMKDRNKNIDILANFLKQLHNIDVIHAHEMGVVAQGTSSRSNIEDTIKVLNERVEKIILHKIININKFCLADEINIVKNLNLPAEQCFVHGDLDSRHLIFEGDKLTGIIDWGDTDITNRAVDLDILWTFFSMDCHEKFFNIYGPVEPATWKYARFLGLYCAFSLALYAIDLQDNLLLTESIAAVKRINEDLVDNLNIKKL